MVVSASERMGARHDVRVKVNQAHGQRIDPGNLNEAVLVDYWENRIFTDELLRRLQRPAVTAAISCRGTLALVLAGVFVSAALAGAAGAGPLDEARAAEAQGDYTTELRFLRPLAEQGNAEAQEALGSLYVAGTLRGGASRRTTSRR